MAQPDPLRVTTPTQIWSPERWDEHLRLITNSIRGALRGKVNNLYRVTLDVDPATQTILRVGGSPEQPGATGASAAFLIPESANAAASINQVWAICQQANGGEVVINHDANPATDRDFAVLVVG